MAETLDEPAGAAVLAFFAGVLSCDRLPSHRPGARFYL